MGKTTPIVNPAGDWEETVVRLAKHLGQNKLRRTVFNVIYGRGTKPKSKKQIMEVAELDDSKSQQVQNALEHLSEHHLIVRSDNDGSISDRSRYVYTKDKFVSANREAIVRRADNKKLAERTPTKRQPLVSKTIKPLIVERRALKKRKKLIVLYLTASPDTDSRLRVDLEVKKVQEAIRASNFRENIDVQFRPAADLDAIIDGLNHHRPQVIHFSGHGDVSGIAADDSKDANPSYQDVSFELLAQALRATDSPPKVIVLNSCSSSGARRVLLGPTQILISMRTGISDIAATAFARRFYAGIANGQSVRAAFEQGVAAIWATSLSEKDTPELSAVSSVNPSKLILT